VLVVDDVPVNRRLLGHVLERAGYAHEGAGDAAAALDLLGSRPYAAILMDLHMPAVDGLEATRRIRALPGPAALTPIIAVTAEGGTETRRRAREAGMNGFLIKLVSLADLSAVLAEAIAERAAR
jgi:CheY-like chemotaxis protein